MKWGRGQCDPGAKLERTGIFTHLSKIPLQLAFTLSKKKFAVSFRYEDFPTGTKTKSETGDSCNEDWQKTGEKQLEVDSRRKGERGKLQAF